MASKPGVEIASNTDAVLFLGSDMPFQSFFIPKDAKYVQVDIDGTKFGRRHQVDLAILADAKLTIKKLMEVGEQLPETNWYRAALADKENWVEWLEKRSVIDSSPLEVEPVFKAINDMATDDAIFQVDVGNVTIDGMRLLDTSKDQNSQQVAGMRQWVMLYLQQLVRKRNIQTVKFGQFLVTELGQW